MVCVYVHYDGRTTVPLWASSFSLHLITSSHRLTLPYRHLASEQLTLSSSVIILNKHIFTTLQFPYVRAPVPARPRACKSGVGPSGKIVDADVDVDVTEMG